MRSWLRAIVGLGCLAGAAVQADPQVQLETSMGTVVLDLDASAAPATVENFLGYVSSGAYEGSLFHRVIPGFMIQGGGFDQEYNRKPTEPPVANEADNGLTNSRGTIAMARTSDPHSASNQFFINVADNEFLDHTEPTPQGWGYCVFGKVIDGMDVVDAIAAVPTGQAGPFAEDAPLQAVTIERASVIE
jgi:cyclophilin family peptidyl-prolyl cis-trans isomerase